MHPSARVLNPRAHVMCSSRQFERKAFRPSVDLYLRKMPFMKGAQVKNFVAPLDITWRRVEAEATSPK